MRKIALVSAAAGLFCAATAEDFFNMLDGKAKIENAVSEARAKHENRSGFLCMFGGDETVDLSDEAVDLTPQEY